jgi:parvulin-like peptidyl-prolyl isomerase
VADIPLDESVPDDPARLPKKPAEPPPQVATRYILIQYKGAEGAPGATLSKEAAGRRAARLARVARKQGAEFLALAKRFSQVPTEERGKVLLFKHGQMAPAFEQAAFGVGIGQVADAVETKFGYYVIMRVEVEEYSTAHILIQYKGAENAPVAIKRTKEEARKKAEVVREKAAKPDGNFAVLAGRYSDSPSRIRGGVLRPMAPGQMPPAYDNYLEAAAALAVGEVSPVVETPFGFHVIKRLKVERIHASHILISYDGSSVAPRTKRSKWEARDLAMKVHKEATAPEADFAALAMKYSDHTESAEKGGDVGRFARGTMPPRFEQIAFSLKVGEISDVVESMLGYHVIRRTR